MVPKRISKSMTARIRVLDAAGAEFSARGYYGSAISDIARRARVNEVTVFRLFGSKEHLYEAVLQGRFLNSLDAAKWSEALAAANAEDPIDVLANSLQKMFDPALTRLMLFAALERPEVARKTISAQIKSLFDALGTSLERRSRSSTASTAEGTPFEAQAQALVAFLMFERVFNRLATRNRATEQEVAERLRALLRASWMAPRALPPHSRTQP